MIDQEILKAQTLKHFPKSLAKKYLVACAKKDLELVKKTQTSVDQLTELNIVRDNDEYCDFKGLLRDCRNQLELIIQDPFTNEQYEVIDGEPENAIKDGKWSLESFVFFTGIYDNCDYQFFPLWEKLIANTKKCLETMGTKVSWSTKGASGDFE